MPSRPGSRSRPFPRPSRPVLAAADRAVFAAPDRAVVAVAALAVAAAVVVMPTRIAAQAPTATGAGNGDDGRAEAGEVRGRVLSAMDRRALEGAAVTLWNESAISASALTGADGSYRLASVPPGRHTLTVSIPDHVPYEVEVRIRSGGELELDVVLSIRPPVIDPVHAIGRRVTLDPLGDATDTADRGPSPSEAAELRSLESGPGGSLAARALAGLRPNPPSSEPAAGLYVRGAASDLKRVYLDGAPVYAPFHLGGLMDALPTGVLGSARLYGGGAPLAVDGGLSSVLDLRTRRGSGDGFRTGGHVDMLGSAVRVEGGGERAAYLLSGRRAHTGGAEWLIGGDLPYGYYDLLGRVDVRPADGHRLAVTSYANEEGVRLGRPALGTEEEGRARWGNEAASLRYGVDLGSTRALLTAATARFTTALPVASDSTDAGGVGGPELGRSETGRSRIALDLTTRTGEVELDYGAALDEHRLELELPVAAALGSAAGARWTGFGRSVAAYGAATVRPTPELTLRGGLRGQLHGDGEGLRLSPRLTVAWQAAEATGLEVIAGRFHQRLEAPESALSGDLDAWTELLSRRSGDGASDPSAFPGLAVASASHLAVRLDHRPTEGLGFGLEGYVKTFDDLGGSALLASAVPTVGGDGAAGGDGTGDGTGGGDRTKRRDVLGDLHASGADLWIDWSSEGWQAWGGYSLAWTWSDAPTDSVARRFAGRQLVSAGVEAPLPGRVRLTGELKASTGLPFTRVPELPAGQTGQTAPDGGAAAPASDLEPGPGLAGTPDGTFLRLDVTLARSWTVRLAGRRTALRPYVRFLNALDRRDGLFFHFDPSRAAPSRALDTMPLVPVVGLAWELF